MPCTRILESDKHELATVELHRLTARVKPTFHSWCSLTHRSASEDFERTFNVWHRGKLYVQDEYEGHPPAWPVDGSMLVSVKGKGGKTLRYERRPIAETLPNFEV